MLRRTGGAAVQFRQSVDEVMVVTFDAVIHGKVDNLQVFRYIMAFHEFLCVTVGSTEEENIDFVQRQLIGESQICLTVQSFMYVGNFVSGITAAVDKYDFSFRMVEQQTD